MPVLAFKKYGDVIGIDSAQEHLDILRIEGEKYSKVQNKRTPSCDMAFGTKIVAFGVKIR